MGQQVAQLHDRYDDDDDDAKNYGLRRFSFPYKFDFSTSQFVPSNKYY